jgi:hypothetical protein
MLNKSEYCKQWRKDNPDKYKAHNKKSSEKWDQ